MSLLLCWHVVLCVLSFTGSNGLLSSSPVSRRTGPLHISTMDELSLQSQRLKRARLRLAEAQGLLPIGGSEVEGVSLSDFTANKASSVQSKVREISWRVAEPAVQYDPIGDSSRLFAQPVRWIKRNIEIFVPLTIFVISVVGDILGNREEQNREKRAEEILDIISKQSPALIKAGQALASRPDLLPKEYLDSLQKLQDRCPAYPTELAVSLFESELGIPLDSAIILDSPEPVAAASIGQVYKGRLRSNGAKVAIKIQRPNCEEAIAIDLFVLRWYAQLLQRLLQLFQRDINLVSVIDDFGDLIYREIDYRAEAVNAQRFAELYASIPDVFVPKVYTDLSTSKVLTMEWVDGARLSDRKSIEAMGLDNSKFVDTLVQCSLRQLLENGFFHADPHAGNLLAMPSGKLCFLDFGMVSYVEAPQRYSIIEAVVHLVNRDFAALTELYRRMGFIPSDVDTAPIILALEAALPDVLNSSVNELNIKNVVNKLGDVMFKFPFSLPPFYTAIIRCLGVLEGVAIQVDKDFRIIEDAYPYIASRLLTDSSTELQSALQQLLFRDGQPRWERLQELLEKAVQVQDYDVMQAADRLLAYLASEKGAKILDIFADQAVEIADALANESSEIALALARSGSWASSGRFLQEGTSGGGVSSVIDAVLKSSADLSKSSPALTSASRVIKLLQESDGLDSEKLIILARKVLREPVLASVVATIVSRVSERALSRTVASLFSGPAAFAKSKA